MPEAAKAAIDKRRLAVAFDPDAVAPMQLHESVREICDLIWLVDDSLGPLGDAGRLLARLGTVVDLTGLDIDGAEAAVKAESPDGVMSFSDRCLLLVSELASRLSLPGMTPTAAETVLGKFHQRAAFAAAGMVGPRTWRVEPGDAAALDTVVTEVELPAVVKPEIGEGSRYVEAATDRHRLAELLGMARDAGRDTVVEELLHGDPEVHPELGDYVSVESFTNHGTTSHAAITGRFPLAPPFRETGYFMPAAIDGDLRQEVLDLATAAIEALDLGTAAVHTEIKLTPDGPRVIEVNGRLGGGMPDLLALASDGVDLVAVAAQVALGDTVVFDELVPTPRTAYLCLEQAPMTAQRVDAIEGLDDLVRREGVQRVRVNREVGADLDWRRGRHDHVYSILGTADGFEELLDAVRLVRETGLVTYG